MNALRVFSTALITLFTMPYLNRVLEAENVGKVEYIFTIINYFVLFSSIGIPMYGIREVSKVRNDLNKLYTLVSELLVILAVTTVISYVLIFGIIIHLNFLSSYRNLLYIMSFMVILNNIGAEWYFQGLENQKFITIRNVLFRFTIFGLIFIFVKERSDYEKYAILFVIMLFGANVINFILIVNKIISNQIQLKKLNLKRHIKPVFAIFVATISVNIYIQLDNFLIGSIAGDKYVAYYTLANKLIRFVITFITIIGSVMLPRLSYLYLNDRTQYFELLKKGFSFMMLLAIPSTGYFFIFSEEIIMFMGGEEFMVASFTMKLLSPLCVIVSFAYFFGFLILYPQGKEKIYTFATIASALLSVLLNYFAIKTFQQNGAAVVALLAECLAICIMFYFVRKENDFSEFFDKNFFKLVYVNMLVIVLVMVGKYFSTFRSSNFEWIILSLIFVLIYGIILLVVKEKNTNELFSKLTLKIRK
ncbi:flippase [Chryseobacterium wangxinyae]|uniref:flippase n=1 Tax=Chryseobacterium sp. CY353 TaxID=2997334 RepID=UPI00226FAF34|nr:flippase [Chryseobacterium sp. CY353]MCY0970071.1 flippase [Chryseobacterium sp. CY353]